MEDKKKETAERKIGVIQDHEQFCSMYVGGGDKNGKEYVLCVGGVTFVPGVKCGEKCFVLDWDDVLYLAEKSGLFDDEEEKEGERC